MNSKRRLMFVLLVCLSAALVHAQSEDIRGLVTDPSGAVIVGASVELKSNDRLIATANTDSQGSYSLVIEREQAFGKLELGFPPQGLRSLFAKSTSQAHNIFRSPSNSRFNQLLSASTWTPRASPSEISWT